MNNKNDFDLSSDDDFYDDALDESFEFEDDYEDIDLESELDESDLEYDDELEDDWEDESIEPEPLSEKKAGFLNFNTIVIAGAVVVGIFIMMAQINPKDPKPTELTQGTNKQAIPTAIKMQGAFQGPGAIKDETIEEKSTSTDANVKSEEDRGFLFDEDVLGDSEEVIEDVPPMPLPIVSEKEESSTLSVAASNDSESLPTKEIKTSVPRGPEDGLETQREQEFVQESIVETKEEVAQKTMEEAEEMVIPETQTKEVLVSEETSVKFMQSTTVNEKLDSIINHLEAMEEKIGNNNSRIEDLVGEIEALKNIKTTTASQKKERSKPSMSIESKKTTVKKPTAKKKATPPKTVKRIQWELRAAQPGKAWVSQKGQKSMRPIVVGDKLTGIGRIQSISYVNGRWVVQGSMGKITQ